MRKGWLRTDRSAFSTVEAILAASMFAMIVTAFMGVYLYGEESTLLGGNRARAAMLAEEGIEVIRSMRDANFGSLVDGTYGLGVAGGAWAFSGSQDVTDGFTRHIDIASVDANHKTVTSTVIWQQNPQRTGSVSFVTRFTNWLAQAVGNWAYPFQQATADVSGTNDAIHVATQGSYAYLIRNGGTNFLVYDISTPSSPVLRGSLTLSGMPTDVAVSGNYAYVSNQSNTQELQIINVSNPAAPVLAGSYDAPGTANANGVFVVGSLVYLVRTSSVNDEFLVINVNIPSSPTLLDSLNLGATGNDVTVVGTHAYVASAGNSAEMQTIDVSNPAALVLTGTVNLSGTVDAMAIAGSPAGVYIGQGSNIHAVNISNPDAPVLVDSLSLGGTVNDIALGGAYAFVGTSVSTGELRIVDVSSPSSLAVVSSVNLAGSTSLNGVVYNASLDRTFGASAANTAEFVVFAPQ